MSVHMTEEEQIERIKKWWREYGNLITTAILIVMLTIVGWNWWSKHQIKNRVQASQVYEQLLDSLANADTSETKAQANTLLAEYKRSSYADFAALVLAKIAVQENDYAKAAHLLAQVAKTSRDHRLRHIASLRQARLLLAQKHYTVALNLLDKVNDSAFLPAVAELRGDIYLAMKQPKQARDAYATALQALPGGSQSNPLLEMKLSELPHDNLTVN